MPFTNAMRRFARLIALIRSLFEPNPVFRRELRARWRRLAAFLTLFFYAAPLAMAMTLAYADKAGQPPEAGMGGSALQGITIEVFGPQLAVIGRQLFESLILLQIVAWLLIAPATAAPTIAAERERGLLEALQLTALPARRVVLGKYLAVLEFLALLMVVPLPIVAICFFFGGLSPWEFAQVITIVAMAAVSGAALGLYFSSRRHRPITALRDAFLIVALWSALAYVSDGGLPVFTRLPLRARQVITVIEAAHPYFSARGHLQGNHLLWPERDDPTAVTFVGAGPALPPQTPPPPPFLMEIDPTTAWMANLGLQAALTLLCVFGAMRATGRPLKESLWHGRPQWVEKLRARWAANAQAARAAPSASERQRLKHRTQEVLVREIPGLSNLSFDNPVFGREMKGKTRWRSAPLWFQIVLCVVTLLALLAYVVVLADIAKGPRAVETWQRFAWFGFGGLSLYAAVTGAAGFTRERENGTWSGIKLSLLAPGEIAWGKFAPVVLTAAALSLPLWPALWCCLGNHKVESLDQWGVVYATGIVRLTPWHLGVVASMLAGTMCFVTAGALLISWMCRRTPTAVGLTIVALPLYFLVVPVVFLGSVTWYGSEAMSLFNPVVALDVLARPEPKPPTLADTYAPDLYFENEKARQQYLENARQSYQEEMAEHRALVGACVLCPVSLALSSVGEMLLLCALMRLKRCEEK